MKNEHPRIFGVLGSGISYSLSPSVFRILFDKYRMQAGYYVFDVKSSDLSDFVRFASMAGISGFNVTIPFKQDIVRHLGPVDSVSAACGSVNLVTSVRGKLKGMNTDWFGIQSVFDEHGFKSFGGKRILVVGAGGTARTAVWLFLREGGRDITVVNRGKARLAEMVREMRLPGGRRRIRTMTISSVANPSSDRDQSCAQSADGYWDIVFNATPVPTARLFPARLFRNSLVFEASYGGLQGGSRRTPGTVGGVDMLIYQALRSFEIFTGLRLDDYHRMKSAIKRGLRLKSA